MSQNFKLLFFLKQGKGAMANSLPVYVRITINGQRAEWSLQRKCEPARWNMQTGRPTGKREVDLELIKYLEAVQGNIYQVQRESLIKNEPVTALEIRSKILHTEKLPRYYLIDIYQSHNDHFEKLVGKEYSNGTFKKFKSALKSLQSFVRWKFSSDEVELSKVDRQFVTDYEFYLKAMQLVQHNSAMSIIKKLKKVVRFCVANDWLAKDPFVSYKITTKDTSRNFLLENELEVLINKPMAVQRLEQVRDIFIFSCYTGLSYTDVASLTPAEIYNGIDGEKWIFTKRNKTKTPSRIPLLPVALNILEKYALQPNVLAAGSLLPRLSNQRLNSYLKEITDICGFNKDLTFHCARHTFATTLTLTNGVPIETVSQMLGHKSLRTTQIYAKILDCKVSGDMKKLKAVLNLASKMEQNKCN